MLTTQYSDVNTATNTNSFDISIFEIIDNQINLTKLAKSQNKDIRKFLENKSTKAFLLALETADQNLGQVVKSINGIGTFGTREVALKVAQWISPEFEVFCIKKLDTLFQTGKVELQPTPATQPTSIAELLEQNTIWLKTLSAENVQLKIEVGNKETIINQLAPKAEFVDKTFTNGQTGLSTMKTVAHECGVSINALYKLLRDSKVWFYQLNAHGQAENAVMAKYIKSGHFEVKQFWSDRQHCYFDKIFATAKGKLLCYKLTKSDINQLIDLELA